YGAINADESGVHVKIANFENTYTATKESVNKLQEDLQHSSAFVDAPKSDMNELMNRTVNLFSVLAAEVASAAETQSPLKPGEDPLQVLLEPLRRVVLMEPAVEQIIYAALSAYTLNPLNVEILKKKTGEGGSYTLLETLKIFPPEDVIILASASPTSFFHEHIEGWVDKKTNADITEQIKNLRDEIAQLETSKTKGDKLIAAELKAKKKELNEIMNNAVGIINLWNKIIVFTEPPSSELFVKLKPLLSHDKPYTEIMFTDKNSLGGMSTVHIRLVGWPAVFVVFSEDEANRAKLGLVTEDQLSSRFVKVEINTNPIKFNAVIKYNAIQHAKFEDNIELEIKMQKAASFIRYLRTKLRDISAPYIYDLMNSNKFIPDKNLTVNFFATNMAAGFEARLGEDMRSFDYLLSLIEIRALLHIDFRLKIKNERVKVIISKNDADEIISKFAAQIISHIPQSKEKEFEILKDVLKDGAKTAEEIYNLKLFSYSSPYSLRTHLLAILARYGYLRMTVDPTDPKHRSLQYSLSNNTPDLIAPVRLGAIGAIAKASLMKWLAAGASLIAPESAVYDGAISGAQLDSLISKYVLCQNVVFGAIEQPNMKQLIAPIAPNRTPEGGAITPDNAIAQDPKPADQQTMDKPMDDLDQLLANSMVQSVYKSDQSDDNQEKQLRNFLVQVRQRAGAEFKVYKCQICDFKTLDIEQAKAHINTHEVGQI
ncbi:MAG: hypothetical protein ACP5NC_06265, partial [Nitrososphaeria archaeon]